MDLLVPIIKRGVDSGELHDVDAREVAIAMGAVMEGTLLLWVYDKNLVESEHHIHCSMKLLLEGMQARPN